MTTMDENFFTRLGRAARAHPSIAEATRDALAAVGARQGGPRLQVEVATRFGSVAREVASEAEGSGAALVVMGTQRRGLVQRALEGSVAEDVLRICPRPVVTCAEEAVT